MLKMPLGLAARPDSAAEPLARAAFQFGPKLRQFCPKVGRFGPNWGIPSSNLHACGCAALLQLSQALGWPALAPMCCQAPLPHAASLPLASARGWLL